MLGASIVVVACGASIGEPLQSVPGGDTHRGQQALYAYGCGSCHTIPGVRDANAKVGPPLSNIAQRGYIGGELANNPDNLVRWIMNPQAVEPGTAMPNLNVNEATARDMAAYLYDLR